MALEYLEKLRGRLKTERSRTMDEMQARRIAEEAAVKASELTFSRMAKEFSKEGGNPVSEKCARVLEDLEGGKVPCWDFRGTRRAAACAAWGIMEERHVSWAEAIREGWRRVRERCVWSE